MRLVVGAKNGRLTRWLFSVVAIGIGVTLSSACSGNAAQSTNTGTATVALNPASGPDHSSPSWSTTAACPTGFRGSAVFRAVLASGQTFSISPATNSVTAPFHGTLELPLNEIQTLARVPNGGTMEFAVICFSRASLTGTSQREMNTFITFSANGSTYTTSGTR
jgi:hypothetical protein